jgi:hypothetical protein
MPTNEESEMPEPDKIVKIDSNLTLDQIKDNCVAAQEKGGFRLTGIKNATMSQAGLTLNFNEAEFVGDAGFFAELLFAEPGATDPEQFKTQKKNQGGWNHMCSGSIWVEDQIKNVMVFGK